MKPFEASYNCHGNLIYKSQDVVIGSLVNYDLYKEMFKIDGQEIIFDWFLDCLKQGISKNDTASIKVMLDISYKIYNKLTDLKGCEDYEEYELLNLFRIDYLDSLPKKYTFQIYNKIASLNLISCHGHNIGKSYIYLTLNKFQSDKSITKAYSKLISYKSHKEVYQQFQDDIKSGKIEF